eukprot:1167306-Amphidinium_carterae.2
MVRQQLNLSQSDGGAQSTGVWILRVLCQQAAQSAQISLPMTFIQQPPMRAHSNMSPSQANW